MDDPTKNPFDLPSDVERKLRIEAVKLPPSKFTREEIIAMLDRGEDITKVTQGMWCMMRGWTAPEHLK